MTVICPTSESAETAFYSAFIQADLTAMADIWSPGEVVCVHPGSSLIRGYDAVMRSWSHIFEHAQGMQLHTRVLHTWLSETVAVHLVEESIPLEEGTALVLATNVYTKQNGDWRIVEHHASAMGSTEQRHTLQ